MVSEAWSVKEVALEKGVLKPKQAEHVFKPEFLLGERRRTKK